MSQCRSTVLKINVESSNYWDIHKMKPPNRRIKPPSEKEQEKPSWDAKNIWGKSQSPFCYMHLALALALEPASPAFVNQQRQRQNGDIHWRLANVGANAGGLGKWMGLDGFRFSDFQNDLRRAPTMGDLRWLKGAHLHFSFIDWIFLARQASVGHRAKWKFAISKKNICPSSNIIG